MKKGHIQFHDRLALWGVESSRLRRMLKYTQGGMKRGLDAGSRALNIQNHPVITSANYLESVGLGKAHNLGVVILGRTKSFRKLCNAQVTVIAGTLRVIQIFQQTVQLVLISSGQRNCQADALLGRKMAH